MKKTLCLGSALLVLGWGQVGTANPTIPEDSDRQIQVDEAPRPSAEPSPPSAEPSEEPVPQLLTPEPPTIELLERGAKPRKKLRFTAQAGEKLRSRMIMTSIAAISINNEPFPSIPIPDIEVFAESETLKVERDGTTHLRFRYLEPTVKSADENGGGFSSFLEDMLKQQFEVLSKATITYVYDKQGRLIETEIETDLDPADPALNFLKQLSQSTQQSSGIFPRKSVGVGAQWSSPQSITLQGKTVTQNVLYELLEIQDDQVKIGTTVDLSNPEFLEDISSLVPSLKNVPMTVEAFEMTAQGDMTIGFSQFMATAMDFQTDGKIVMLMPAQDQEIRIEVVLTSRIKTSPHGMTAPE